MFNFPYSIRRIVDFFTKEKLCQESPWSATLNIREDISANTEFVASQLDKNYNPYLKANVENTDFASKY